MIENNTIQSHRKSGYLSFISTIIMTSLTLASGIIYLVFQWFYTNKLEDTYFVSMLIGATMFLLLGLRYLGDFLLNKGEDFYSFVISTTDPELALKNYNRFFINVFNFKKMTMIGFIYGAIIGSAPFALSVWSDTFVLQLLLSIFMFTVNFVTGISFYSLISFFINSVKMGKMIKVDLWQIENPSTLFLLGATRRISVLASIYIAICLTSILFSKLPLDSLVVLYSFFSASIILLSVIIPSYPIVHKLKLAKEKNLLEIDNKLNEIFYQTLEEIKSTEAKVDLERFDSLLQLRSRIVEFSIFPFRAKSISAALSILIFSSIPVIIQVILEKLF